MKRGYGRFVPWVLAPAMLLIYASHPTRKFYFDGVVFASLIEHGPFEKLFNPHHLLYTPLFYLIHHVLETAAGRPVQALFLMQWANILLGAAGVVLIWRLISRLVPDQGLAFLMTLLGCFSFTYWHYTTDADVYIISMCFLLLAADRLLALVSVRPRTSDFVFVGLMHSASILFHQLNVFWIVCVAASLAFGVVRGTPGERRRWWWSYFAAVALPTAFAYILVGIVILKHTSPGSFLYWLTQYGHERSYWIASVREIPLSTLNGYLMVFFHRPSITPNIMDYDLGLAMEEGRFWKGFIKTVFGHYSLGFLFFCYLAALYNLKKYLVQFRSRAIFAMSWLAPYVLFQLFFMPTNYFYKLFIFVPLLAVFAWYESVDVTGERRWLKLAIYACFIVFTAASEPFLGALVALFVAAFEVFRGSKASLYRWGLFILVTFLPLYNYIAGIAPESRLSNNPEVEAALALGSHLREGDIIIFTGGHDYPDGWIIGALTPAKVVALRDLWDMTEHERAILFRKVSESGGRILVHPNVTEAGGQLEKCARERGVTPEALLQLLRRYGLREIFTEGNRTYFELIPPP